jgi:hypothetical protein
MTFSLLKPVLVMATLFMAMGPAWGAQNPSLTPTGDEALAAHKPKTPSTPAKSTRTAPKKMAPPDANYNVGELPPPVKPIPKAHPGTTSKKQPGSLPFAQRMDINSASKEELKKLPGIFDAEAAKIIAHRPYKSKAGLVVEAGLTGAQYFAIKDRVKAVQHSTK